MTSAHHDPGFDSILPFASDAAIRRVHRESVLLLGGGRALLMQIAHPAVAQGVAEHSNFRAGRWTRLVRTLRPTLAIAFGDREQALGAAASINRQHESVIGQGYDARDPELLLWVLATLIDTALVTHARFLRPLTREEAEAYYADMSAFGRVLGIPPRCMPPGLDAFDAYMQHSIASLRVSDGARDIVRDLFRPGPVGLPLLSPALWLTAGLLPAELRQQFGLGWGPRRERALRGLEAASRRLLPYAPAPLRATPWFLMPGRTPR
jgi:uncharacterized protein (DUF2236 family)